MRDYLVFQLYAPLVSWGDQAVGQERPTADHPSRSALLGLLGAALGIERDDEAQHQQLSDACYFAVKLYAPGLALRDFHTAQVPPQNKKAKHLFTRKDELSEPKLGTILSFRSYQQESLSVVAVWLEGQSAYDLTQLQQALQQPHYHLYLGRKSCPLAAPVNPLILKATNFAQVLDHYSIDGCLFGLFKDNQPRYYWEQTAGCETALKASYRVPRYDQPLSRARWQFVSREEYVLLTAGGS
ncbi:MAG: type I-E CRISPR-associated protein Cas5/CasD [Thiolinea sp.]